MFIVVVVMFMAKVYEDGAVNLYLKGFMMRGGDGRCLAGHFRDATKMIGGYGMRDGVLVGRSLRGSTKRVVKKDANRNHQTNPDGKIHDTQ